MSVVFILRPVSWVVVDVAVCVFVLSVTSDHMVIVSSLPDIMTDLVIAVSFE